MNELKENERYCKNCVHFYKGECRRFPPQACCETQSETNSSVFFPFPTVHKEEWCGEFKENESKYPHIPEYLLN